MRGGAGRAFLLKEGVGIMEVLLEGLGLVLQTSLWGKGSGHRQHTSKGSEIGS